MHNLIRNFDVRRAMNAVAAGTTDTQTGIVIDTLGYNSVAFVVAFGTITATGTATVKVQQGDAANLSDAADLVNTGIAVADDDDNKLAVVEVYRPKKRYVRVAVVRATANVVIDGAVAILGHGETKPPEVHSTLANTPEIHASPAEGTA